MYRVFDNKLKSIEDRLNKSDNANHILIISKNETDNKGKWTIIDNYYISAGKGKQKIIYTDNYNEYLQKFSKKPTIIIDDI